MAKPRIGIPVSRRANDGSWQLCVSDDLIRAIHQSGGVSIIIPQGLGEDLQGLLESVQGFVLPGGLDLDPRHYGQEPLPGCGQINPHDDELHLAVARYALARDLPILGICRGMQVLNVAAKGTLHQDISTWAKVAHQQRAPKWHGTHLVQVIEGSIALEMFGARSFWVNSFHHQAVDMLGEDLISAACSTDGVIEALASARHKYVLGLQWHPELLIQEASFAQLPFVRLTEIASKSQGR